MSQYFDERNMIKQPSYYGPDDRPPTPPMLPIQPVPPIAPPMMPVIPKPVEPYVFPIRHCDTNPIALAAFAITIMMLSFTYVTAFPVDVCTMGCALFLTGTVMFTAGIYQIKLGSIFGSVVYCCFAGFWLVWYYINLIPGSILSKNCLGTYLMLWSVFTFFLFAATIPKAPWTIKLCIFLLAVTLLILAIGAYKESNNVNKVGGCFGLACGICAFWGSVTGVINDEWGYGLLPV